MPLTSAGIGADCQARFANSQEQMVRTAGQKAKNAGLGTELCGNFSTQIYQLCDLATFLPFLRPPPRSGGHIDARSSWR